MDRTDDIIRAMNRLADELRDSREETRRLRESLEKVLAFEPKGAGRSQSPLEMSVGELGVKLAQNLLKPKKHR